MISYRDNDASEKGIKHFPFMSVHKWGETPIGRWTLRVETRTPKTRESERTAMKNDPGELIYFGLRLYGSYTSNNEKSSLQKRQESNAFVPTEEEIKWIYKRELSIRESPNVMQKRDYQNLIDKRQHLKDNSDQSLFSTFRKKFGF
jgi:proprotein convertase P-domain-containing protein